MDRVKDSGREPLTAARFMVELSSIALQFGSAMESGQQDRVGDVVSELVDLRQRINHVYKVWGQVGRGVLDEYILDGQRVLAKLQGRG